MKKLSVVIVNYNVKFFLEQCLDSVRKATDRLDAEVYVVDNNSSDGSVEYLSSRFPEVIFIENKENAGFAVANNQAIRQAQGDYVLVLNPDTVVGENSLLRVCEFMDNHPDAGALGVKMIDGYGSFLPESKRGFPSPWASFSKMTGLARLFPQSPFFGGYHLRYLNENATHEVDVLAGAFMLLRKEALDQAGLLDEAFFMYGEDIDLSYRVKQSGYKNYYFPERIIHYKGESTKKDFKYVKIFYEAMLIFYNKHYPTDNTFAKLLIRSAIHFTSLLSMIGKVFKREKKQEDDRPVMVMNTGKMTYEEIITVMDRNQNKKTLYRIDNPERGISVQASL
jgi:Predicted glycosyltransferases